MTRNQTIINAYLALSGRVRGPKANNNNSAETIKTERAIQTVLRRAFYPSENMDKMVAGGVTAQQVLDSIK